MHKHPPSYGPIPSLPLTTSHSPFVFDSWEALFKLFWQLHLFETLESYQREAWLRLPVTSTGSISLFPLPGSAPLQEPTGSPSPSWAGAPATPAPARLYLGNSVFWGSRACTVTALQHLPAFTECQSSLNSDAGYRAPLHGFGEESSKIFYFRDHA